MSIQVSKIRCKSLFGAHAKSGAKKLCGIGQCICNFECGHPNKIGQPYKNPDGYGQGVCPIAEYGVQPEHSAHPWWERDRDELEPSDEELFSICACCGNTVVTFEAGSYTAAMDDPRKCFGCPVKMAEENMAETAAAARMS